MDSPRSPRGRRLNGCLCALPTALLVLEGALGAQEPTRGTTPGRPGAGLPPFALEAPPPPLQPAKERKFTDAAQPVLTLAQAVALALRQNPQMSAAAANALIVEARINQVRSGWLPQINLNASLFKQGTENEAIARGNLEMSIASAQEFATIIPAWSMFTAGYLLRDADHQLKVFKADPANRGAIMDRGLWSWTRHPNYFGDACVWWGLWLVTITGWPALATVLSPVLMTYFLVYGTGARVAEKHMAGRPGFSEYCSRTAFFVPRPPR